VFAEGGSESARSSGRLQPTGLRPKLADKLHEAGINLAPKLFRGNGSLGAGLEAVESPRSRVRRRV
jgi:hypothetical protein